MSTLWIIHRNPNRRTALARISGRAANEIVSGAPRESDFADQAAPTAILLAVEGDFELELDFVHRMGARLRGCRWILLADEEDTNEAARLFDLIQPEILESLPTARVLRAQIADAFARRRAESLVERRSRERIAERFSTWLGGVEIPGLLRALDPALGHLPLLVRGLPGSGRALLARYVELFRAEEHALHHEAQRDDGRRELGAALRVHARDLTDLGELSRRIEIASSGSRGATLSVWIDEIDMLSISTQNTLAEWIVHETPSSARGESRLHWLATASPAAWQDPLEEALERAFAPLIIEVPGLLDDPDTLPTFAREIARDWSRAVGGAPRTLSTGALAELTAHPFRADRSEVEAVLRATFASTSRDPVEAEDLCFELGRGPGNEPARDRVSDEAPTNLEPPLAEVIATEEISLDLPDADFPEAVWVDEGDTRPTPDANRDADVDLDGEGIDGDEDVDGDGPTPMAGSVDDSVLLSEASFDLAESDALDASLDEAVAESPVPDPSWRRLARSLSHEIRNPLVSIRTFAELLPEHYADETFRARFADLVGRDVAHIDDVVTRMQNVAEHEESAPEAIDVSVLIEQLLEERRERIEQGRLLVLRELERDAPMAWAQPVALRVSIAGLLDRALDSLPERGDLFVATRRIEGSTDKGDRLRILLRHHNPEALGSFNAEMDELRPESNVLEYVLAETVARASGGSLTIDTSDAQETLILVELRTPR